VTVVVHRVARVEGGVDAVDVVDPTVAVIVDAVAGESPRDSLSMW
jgi:hypothetical protein